MPAVQLQQAYAFLHVKSLDVEQRTITGIASTPEPDRMGDVVESLGVTFKNPVPLLLHHKADQPVGHVQFLAPTKDGIAFVASLPTIPEPGALRDRIDTAWQSLKAKLIAGVSIGFVPLVEPTLNKKTGGFVFTKSEILELSLVTIPANAGATIHTIKSLDRAASGAFIRPGVTGPHSRNTPMTIQEQITHFTAQRTNKAAAMTALMQTSADSGVTLDAAQTEEYDGLDADVKSLDAHLVRLSALDATNRAAAAPLPPTPATPERPHIVQVRSVLPAGTAFTRLVMARVFGKGDSNKEIEYAKRWKDSTPEVELILRAAVAPGTTTAAGWAAELAQLKPLTDEFLEFVRPATILGKISGMRRVPFNVSIATQTAGGTYQWVGQGAPKPVGKLTFGSATLGITKCAGIIVISEELARVSSPSAEETIRNDMRDGIAAFLDVEFTDPTKAPVANVAPGSITNGVTPITSAGTSPVNARTDIAALLAAIVNSGNSVKNAHLLMSETNAMALGFSATALAAPLFPGLGPSGGTALSVTVLTSQVLGANIIALDPAGILYADDGGINIDVSREASVQMDSAPTNPADATTIMTSFWQNNLIGLRAERFINWKKARAGSVQLTSQTYITASMSPSGVEGGTPLAQRL